MRDGHSRLYGAIRCLAAAIFASLASGAASAAEPLPRLGADTSGVTVSGVSSGANMAVQMHVARSASVKGAGVVAGGPYYCARGSVWLATVHCMKPNAWAPLPPLARLRSEVDGLAAGGQIDPPVNLQGSRAWLFSGTHDRTVLRPVVAALRDFYAAYGVQAVFTERAAGHGMVTESFGAACSDTAAPYINDCDYDAAGELLNYLLGPLKPPAATATGQPIAFDQQPFAKGARMHALGYVYIPQSCRNGGCRVHVAFHGCGQGAHAYGDRFAREAGYNRWAESNRLVVLYPQATANYSLFAFNPGGCWDWWGYTGSQYHTREAPQIRAVTAMLERLAAASR